MGQLSNIQQCVDLYRNAFKDSDVAMISITRDVPFMTEKEMLTSFASCTEEDKEVDFTYEAQPFEATEERKGNPTHGEQDA